MEVLTLIEHEVVPVVVDRARGQKAIGPEHASALSRLQSKLPAKAFVWGHQTIKIGHYCGVITLGNLSIEILPKIYGKELDPGSSRQALVRMLIKSRRMKLQRSGTAEIALQRHNLLDVFVLHFCEQLHAQLMQGMIREYIQREENLNVLRGRLRVEQQLKRNLAHRERLYCQYDELSADNLPNQILKYTLTILARTSLGSAAQKAVVELLMRFDPISDTAIDVSALDCFSLDRSTNRYEPIFEQCRWFLEGLHPDILAGKSTCLSLMFDMNRLFESYVAVQLRKVAWREGLRLREQGPQKYLARREDTDQQVFLMKPDISLIDQSNQVIVIADAKWKILDESEKKLGISQADLYQMESYAARYRINDLILVYPKQSKLTRSVTLLLDGSGSRLVIYPLDVSSSGDMDDFVSRSIGRTG